MFIEGAVQMLVSQVIIGALLMKDLKTTGSLHHGEAIVVLTLVCIFVGGFAWSWGPLAALIPSEIFPLQTRTAGFSCSLSTNMSITVFIARAFLSMLCTMRAGVFFFFAAWILVMGLFALLFFIPEGPNQRRSSRFDG